jgi:hypothetical protein
MSTLPIISINSEKVLEELGVDMALSKSARRRSVIGKLTRLGVVIFDKEFISHQQLQLIAENKIKGTETHPHTDWLKGSSFEGDA